jgi:hypothetical protein
MATFGPLKEGTEEYEAVWHSPGSRARAVFFRVLGWRRPAVFRR